MLCIRVCGLFGILDAGSHVVFHVDKLIIVQSYLYQQHDVFQGLPTKCIDYHYPFACFCDLRSPSSFHDTAYRMDASIFIIVA